MILGNFMYAIINNGGKQYKVTQGTIVKVEKLALNPEEVVEFPTLLVANGDTVVLGKPIIANATVEAKVIAHGLADKVHIVKHRRRKHYIKRQGHRQEYTKIEITNIIVK